MECPLLWHELSVFLTIPRRGWAWALSPVRDIKRDKVQGIQGIASTTCRGPMAGTCLGLVSTNLLQGGS